MTFYGIGHDELLIREALVARNREDVTISVTFGALRDPAGGWGGFDDSPRGAQELSGADLQLLCAALLQLHEQAADMRALPGRKLARKDPV